MDNIGCRGNENHSKTDNKLSCLRRGSTTAAHSYERPSSFSKDELRERRQQNCTSEVPLSRSFPERMGMLYGPCPKADPASKLPLTPAVHGRSNFVPMDSRALGASIKREENWSYRSRSPSRKPRRPPAIKFSICQPSVMTNETEVNEALSQTDDYSSLDDFDELGVSDDEETKNFLLGVSTPTTLRRRTLQLSLNPVDELKDDFAKEKCASEYKAN